MYGQGAGTLTTATGIALLPNTGSNRTLFVIAISLLVIGSAVFVASAIAGRKARVNEAK